MKKIIALAAAVCLTLFYGCGPKDEVDNSGKAGVGSKLDTNPTPDNSNMSSNTNANTNSGM